MRVQNTYEKLATKIKTLFHGGVLSIYLHKASKLGAFLETVTETLARGDNVQLVGFGSFKTSERKARSGRNPRTGETVSIPAKKVPSFTA